MIVNAVRVKFWGWGLALSRNFAIFAGKYQLL